MYLRYAQLTETVQTWADEHSDFVRLSSLGETEQGRQMWLLAIGPEPDRARPSVWVDGNMHAVELCGSAVALRIARDVIALHADPKSTVQELPPHVCDRLREVVFYILPRMSPDGAECILDSGRYVRSVPRDHRKAREHARWVAEDLDGDGLALLMRLEDPAGEFVESTDVPGLMLPRRLEDPPPYYKIYPEGRIENFNGHDVPDPFFLSDNQTDLNRNFPYMWAPEHEQIGAGSHPMSEPESRAVVEFAAEHPELFLWMNLHTFGGVFIRPLGAKPDSKMHPQDLALFRQIGAWAEEITGYPMVSGFEEFTYEPDKPIYGDLSEYAYHGRGCIAYVVELWDLFKRMGHERKKRFVDHYDHLTRDQMLALGVWDRDHNQSRVVRPWKPVDHPQLGPVEVGGVDPRFGMWNPPPEQLDAVCEAHSSAFLRVAALAPAVRAETIARERVADGVWRATVRVRNEGYLPTYILGSAKGLDIAEPLYAEIATAGCELVAGESARRQLGHLEGWGRGLYAGADALFHQRSSGSGARAQFSFTVRGDGRATVRVGSCRVGWIEHVID